MSKIELLAPVGHFEGLRAAVVSGADAIYVGGPSFGARKEAAFTHDELVEVIEFCHLYDVRTYVTINTTIFDDEIRELENYIHFLYINGADAVIIQDLAAAKLVRTLYPDFEIHISTQMHIHNRHGVEFAKEIGAARVVAARENSLDEIHNMCQTGLDVEVFVHGALCFCYSGQCLMSSMIGGRSGNRGACAQPCRLPYELVDLELGKTLNSDTGGHYKLSPRDLKTVDDLGQLICAGATSFKIEGRLKKPEYVAAVVKAYRTAIDQYLENRKIQLDQKLHDDMTQVFNRKFTKGFLHGEAGRNWIGTDRPGHRGVLVGKVINVKGNRAMVKLTRELHLHDGVRFVGSDEFGMQVQKMFVDRQDVKIAKPGMVDLICNFTPQIGMEVYKTTSAALVKEFEVNQMPKIPISGEVKMMIGESLTLSIWDNSGNIVSNKSEEIVQRAQNSGITKERLKQQLEKTGSTPFAFDDLTIQTSESGTIPISVINQLRRELLEKLALKRRNPHQNRTLSEKETNLKTTQSKENSDKKLTVSVRNLNQLRVVCTMDEVQTIYFKGALTLKQAIEIASASGKELIPQISRVMEDVVIEKIRNLLWELGIKRVMVGEYGTFEALRRDFEVMTDYSIHTNNALNLAMLADFGAIGSTFSYEITSSKMRKLAKNSPLPLEAVVFTRVPLMITKHCPIKTHHQSDDGSCKGKYCNVTHGLRDRKGKIMPMIRSGKCKIEILNHEPLILIEQLNELAASGVNSFRLEFTTENEEEIKTTIQAFDLALRSENVDKAWLARHKYTKGHYNRGVQ